MDEAADLSGSITATVPDTAEVTPDATYDYDPFGAPAAGTSGRYRRLGTHQRAADDLGGIVLMGQQRYDPATGPFLSIDPVEGGSANNYDYCSQTPSTARTLAVNGDGIAVLTGCSPQARHRPYSSIVHTCCR